MTLADVDWTGEASQLAGKAEAALGQGDTACASDLFAKAGERLEHRAKALRKSADKHLACFLAATQFYKGGHYQKALELCRKIQQSLLPSPSQALYPPFKRDVEQRADPRYPHQLREQLLAAWGAGDHQGILRLLQDHPYALPPAGLAFLRAVCCEHLRDYETAAVFWADAIRFAAGEPAMISLSAAYVLMLIQTQLDDASEYLRHQLDFLPYPLTHANVSLLRYFQASRAKDEQQRRELTAAQIESFQAAWKEYQRLPLPQQREERHRELMLLAFEAVAFALERVGRRDEALRVCEEAIAFAPASPGPRTVRGIVTYPSPESLRDFEEALRLGEQGGSPYFFLAHAALRGGDYAKAETLCLGGLRSPLDDQTKAQYLEWLAISGAALGRPREDVQGLFEQALTLNPEDHQLRQNAMLFQAGAEGSAFALDGSGWRSETIRRVEERYVAQQGSRLTSEAHQEDLLRKQLMPAVA